MSARREQIVEAAREVFREQGLTGISVRAVASRANIGASTLRHYFPTQRDLHDAVFASAFDSALDDLRIGDRTVPPRERLVECLTQFLPPQDTPDESLVQWLDSISAIVTSSATPEHRAAWSAFVRQARLRVVRWLEVLEGEGALRPGTPERHARLLMTVLDGLALGMVLPLDRLTALEVHESLEDAVAAVVR